MRRMSGGGRRGCGRERVHERFGMAFFPLHEHTMTLFVSLVAAAILLGLAYVAKKIRSVHLMLYRVQSDVEATQREAKTQFSQVQSLLALERLLALPQPLPPMRGWAGSPDFLLALANEIRAARPRVIVECSSGVSTVVAARCLQQLGAGHVWSLEQESVFAAKTTKLLAEHGLAEWATVIVAPLQQTNTATPWYEDRLPPEAQPIDLLVVDGPPTAVAPLARMPAFPQLKSRLAARCTILADDAARDDEQEMVRRWCQQEPALQAEYVPLEKGLAVLRLGT
jgi:predicted O-methyltransferase YrrM